MFKANILGQLIMFVIPNKWTLQKSYYRVVIFWFLFYFLNIFLLWTLTLLGCIKPIESSIIPSRKKGIQMSNGSGFALFYLAGVRGWAPPTGQKTSCNEKGRYNRLNFFRLTWLTTRPNAIAIAELTLAYIVIEMESSSCSGLWFGSGFSGGRGQRLVDDWHPHQLFT